MAKHGNHLVRNCLVTAGLFVVGSLAVAGPATAASSAAPTPVPTSTVAPSPVPSAPSLSATPQPSETDPGSIQVPAGNAYTGKDDSGTPWIPVALLGGGVLLLGAGGVTVARRR